MNAQKLHEDILDHSAKAKARMRQLDTLIEAEKSGRLSASDAAEMSREILREAAAEADKSVDAIDTLRSTGELKTPPAGSAGAGR